MRQLGAVDMDDLRNGDIDIDDVSESLAPKFASTFKSLFNVMTVQETKLQMKEAKQASQFSSRSESTPISQDRSPHKSIMSVSSESTNSPTNAY